MPIYAIDGKAPAFEDADSNWIAPDATLIGNIRIGRNAGFWFGVGAPRRPPPRGKGGAPPQAGPTQNHTPPPGNQTRGPGG
ncbi:gamma carbonic anhydrase family protein, partial [Mesorhizobium sp. M0027]